MVEKLFLLLFALTHPTIPFVEAAGDPNTGCTCENNGLNCPSMNLQTVPGQLDENLIFIILEENNIDRINRMDFAGLINLMTLSLSSNVISSIDDGSFSDLVNLRTLLLDKNLLTSLIPGHFVGLTSLETIFLHGNVDLTIDPCLFSDLASLNTLSLQQTKVDLDNALVTPSSACSSMHSLLTRFPYVENLRILSIGYEGTSSKATTLQNFVSLRKTTLVNFTKEFFDNFNLSNLEQLEEVTLLSVPVYPSEFLVSSSLTKLTIAFSTFTLPPRNALKNIPLIETLLIFNNSLSFIEEGAFSGARKLTSVSLSFNKLHSLLEGIFEADHEDTTALPSLMLSGNEWHCDCKMKWLQELLSSETNNNIRVVCNTPNDKAGKSISDVNLECESITERPNSNDLRVDPFTSEIITRSTSTETTTSTHPLPSNPTSSLVYIVAPAGAVLLISLIIIMIICIVINKKKEKREPQHPPSKGETFCEDDPYYTKVDDKPVYDTTINRNFNEINATGLSLPGLSSGKVSSPNQYLNQKWKKPVKSGRTNDSPDYANTQRGHFTLNSISKSYH